MSSANAADPRYPIGPFVRPAQLTTAQRADLTARIGRLPEALRAAVAGLNDQQLNTPYREGGWTLRQVVLHLGDSHLNALTRVKLTLTEERPTVRPYDENSWLSTADMVGTTLEQGLAFVAEIHRRLHLLALSVTDQTGARRLLHPESGEQSLDQLLANYAWHGDHHVAHITALRYSNDW